MVFNFYELLNFEKNVNEIQRIFGLKFFQTNDLTFAAY